MSGNPAPEPTVRDRLAGIERHLSSIRFYVGFLVGWVAYDDFAPTIRHLLAHLHW